MQVPVVQHTLKSGGEGYSKPYSIKPAPAGLIF